MEVRQRVREVTTQDGWALIKVNRVPDQPGVAAQIFTKVAAAGVPIGLILQNASVERMTDVSFTVRAEDVSASLESLSTMRQAIGAGKVQALPDLAVVQIVGTGILTDPSYVGRIFTTMADAGVNILAVGTSEIRITILVDQEAVQTAQQALHKHLQVGEAPAVAHAPHPVA